MSLSVAWQSRSQCITALYSYEIATSRPGARSCFAPQ
jgi:hypothetical protein